MAIIGAIVLIALAVVARAKFADDDGSGSTKERDRDGRSVVACTPELAAVCDAMAEDGSIAKDPPTLELDEAAAPDASIDGWITWDPAPQIANFDAGQNPTWGDVEALGSARLAVLLDPASSKTLVDDCEADTVWDCIASAPSSGLTVGVGDPTTSEGLSRLLPLAVALSPELDGEALDASDVRDIVDSADPQADAATMSLTAIRPGAISIVVGPEAVLGDIAGSAQGKSRRLSASVATPKTTATVVLATRTGSDLGDLADACEDDAVAQALRDAGVAPCSDDRDELDANERAGFLYTVREKAS